MSKLRVATVVFLVGMAAVGVTACSSNSSSSTTTAAATNTKTAFCGYNTTLDQASANVNTPADFLPFLKAHQTLINNFASSIPNDSIKAQATDLIDTVRHAVATNDASAFTGTNATFAADGAAVDTYCGTQGDGSPLPANFGAGKGSTFCADEAAISAGVSNAATPADVVTFLKANQAKITDFAANIPTAVQSDAQSLATAVNAAVAANDGTLLQTQAVGMAANHVDLYCGVNH